MLNARDHFISDAYSGAYSWGEYDVNYLNPLRQNGAISSGDYILDVGAGGCAAAMLSFGEREHQNVHAITDHPSNIDPWIKGFFDERPESRIIQGNDLEDVNALDVPSLQNTYKIVICHRVLRYIRNSTQLIENMLSKVEPGGFLAIEFLETADGANATFQSGEYPDMFGIERSAIEQIISSNALDIIYDRTYDPKGSMPGGAEPKSAIPGSCTIDFGTATGRILVLQKPLHNSAQPPTPDSWWQSSGLQKLLQL